MRKKEKFVVCIRNDECEDLERLKIYRVLPDQSAKNVSPQGEAGKIIPRHRRNCLPDRTLLPAPPCLRIQPRRLAPPEDRYRRFR